MKNFNNVDLTWSVPLSLVAGASLTNLQRGLVELARWDSIVPLFFLHSTSSSIRWAGGNRTLAWMVALAFVCVHRRGDTHLALPVYGHTGDEERSTGSTYTDAYRRDGQAWRLPRPTAPFWMPSIAVMHTTNMAACLRSVLLFTVIFLLTLIVS